MHTSIAKLAALVLAAAVATVATTGCTAEIPDEGVGESSDAIVGGQASGETLAVGYINTVKNGVVDQAICTGNLIAPDVVVTAAHCLDFPAGYTFTFGIGKVGKRATIAAAGGAYDSSYREVPSRDIGYLVLAEPVKGVTTLQVERTSHAPGCNYVTTGYGVTTSGYKPGDPLDNSEWGTRKIASVCAGAGYSEGFIAATGKGGSGCNGDSGGALRRGHVMMGVLTGGLGACERRDQLFYTPTATNLGMIDEALSKSRVGR